MAKRNTCSEIPQFLMLEWVNSRAADYRIINDGSAVDVIVVSCLASCLPAISLSWLEVSCAATDVSHNSKFET
jgi:hypothetical protein